MSVKVRSGLTESSKQEQNAESKMRNAEEGIRDLDHERLLVFDKDGNVIHTIEGEGTSVDSDERYNQLLNEGKVYSTTHNHPVSKVEFNGKSYDREGGPFSPGDIEDIVKVGLPVERVVSNQMSYVLRRMTETGASRNQLFGKKAGEAFSKNRNDFARDYGRFVNNAQARAMKMTESLIRSGKLPYNERTYVDHSMNLWIRMSEKWLSNHAKEYGYDFHAYRRK